MATFSYRHGTSVGIGSPSAANATSASWIGAVSVPGLRNTYSTPHATNSCMMASAPVRAGADGRSCETVAAGSLVVMVMALQPSLSPVRYRATGYFPQSLLDAIAAPSDIALSLAHTTSSWP